MPIIIIIFASNNQYHYGTFFNVETNRVVENEVETSETKDDPCGKCRNIVKTQEEYNRRLRYSNRSQLSSRTSASRIRGICQQDSALKNLRQSSQSNNNDVIFAINMEQSSYTNDS